MIRAEDIGYIRHWSARGILPSIGWRGLYILAVIGAALAAGALRTAVYGIPVPSIQDEFAYLLGADTFASGHLVNPMPQFWEHFETTFVNLRPTYISKYPPGQSLFLAFGQRFLGHPVAGVWLSTALACGAISWMLLEWVPMPWALLGAFIAVVRLVAQYWDASYWGGSVAALGGALLLGPLPRLPDRFVFSDGLVMGIGLAILANTRPAEGLTIVVVAVGVAFCLLRPVFVRRLVINNIAVPILLVMGPTVLMMAYYNALATGSPFIMPYIVNQRTYFSAPVSLFAPLAPTPQSLPLDIAQTAQSDAAFYAAQHTLHGFLKFTAKKLSFMWSFYVGLSLTPLLLLLCLSEKDRYTLFALWTCGVSMVVMLHQTWLISHYTAPFAGLMFVIVAQALRQGATWRRHRTMAVGRVLVFAALILHCFFLVAPMRGWGKQLQVGLIQPWAIHRAQILSQLKADGHRHLILVRYGAGHNPLHQWVYNDANIERSSVIWARDLGEERNRLLMNYYKDRTIWLLDAEPEPGRLTLVHF